VLTQKIRRWLRSLRAHWEIWASSLLVISVVLTLSWFVLKVSQLFEQKVLNPFEATSLIVQAILAPLTAAPVLAAVLIAVASLRAQQKVQKDARRAIVDVRLISPLKAGATQYERLGTVNVTNLGPGPAMDVNVEVWVLGISPIPRNVGVLGPQGSTDASVTTEISLPTEIFGQNVQLIAKYIDLFSSGWKSVRIYTSFPAGEGPLTVQEQCEG